MLNDTLLERSLESHEDRPGLRTVVEWLRPVEPELRLRALGYYLTGLAPDQLCARCRWAVGFPYRGEPAAEKRCVRCAALVLAADLDESDRRRLDEERALLAQRVQRELERGAEAAERSIRLRDEARAARQRSQRRRG